MTETATVWLLPAATVNGEEGDVVTPAGKPESVAVTGSENPFWPVIDTAKLEFELPALAVTVAGVTARLKSGGGLIVNDKSAAWVNAPEVPVAVTE